ncbi:protein of unknown function [endosymbiont DhMRE of Dentiscutata heterogama]|uniref:hypothetical protein n=1 Tax=endosymbiont DhMRE of Dentiscutata heterogama TaxID=1609546 RepID=UPI000629D7F3|nr:hypothetical protein [endosymbiont DhMRE of Dentiscutata heterogama]CFW92975.1 protein of unknown function [endosymbiont DhMRE of Dentiscutata heterogama]
MPKCWIHSETAEKKPTKPLKTHPGFPEDSIKQGLALALVSKSQQIRDWAIQPYRHWEFEGNINLIRKFKKEKKLLTQFLKSYGIETDELADLKTFIDNLLLKEQKYQELLDKIELLDIL